MKTFEENWTAWIDGELTGKELVEFEASLSDRAAAETEKRAVHKLGILLKAELKADAMANAEFFWSDCARFVFDSCYRRDAAPGRRRSIGFDVTDSSSARRSGGQPECNDHCFCSK